MANSKGGLTDFVISFTFSICVPFAPLMPLILMGRTLSTRRVLASLTDWIHLPKRQPIYGSKFKQQFTHRLCWKRVAIQSLEHLLWGVAISVGWIRWYLRGVNPGLWPILLLLCHLGAP